ncbi:Uncharacterised protein [Yersinia aldovae]|uniref:Uncharacterized protein n=1 Tax=Yersinia aldovae TaxID=29483 RepID=A0ABM9SRH0_YERAL|nr:Uncharacterised protein [Yersinia aldovae]CNK85786.1 Uncharacterised protein [Yersinia aldovae]
MCVCDAFVGIDRAEEKPCSLSTTSYSMDNLLIIYSKG